MLQSLISHSKSSGVALAATATTTTNRHPSIQYRAQPIVKLAFCLITALIHLVTPALAAPFSYFATDVNPFAALGHGHDDGSHHGPDVYHPLQLTLSILTIATLVILGGIFAGLTLGLMGLDMVNLQVLASSGTENERAHATAVLKLLEKGRHWVLVVLLLGNVIVNETLPVFLSDFGGGITAVLSSTVLIVIFGEVVPQSICARYGLAIGAICAPMVHCLMLLMAPVAWPTAKLLDWCLGEEHGTTYRKAELKTFVSLHQQIGTENLNEDEVTIIRAVLDLNDKCVQDILTPIDDVFIMASDTILDEATIDKLVQSGYSRVPIHEPEKPDAIVGMLLVKNLIQYDPEDALPVSSFHLTPLPEASPDLTLLDCLNYFQQGRSHMILVSAHPGESRGALGVVTLEDVIEEMIGEEIVDETDVFVDVHKKVKVVRNPPKDANPQHWQPLIRGIIERRRKFGGPTKAPLRRSYGTFIRSNANANNNNTAQETPKRQDTSDSLLSSDPSAQRVLPKYGLSAEVRAIEKIAIKRPGSPLSVSSNSNTVPPTDSNLFIPRRNTHSTFIISGGDGFTDDESNGNGGQAYGQDTKPKVVVVEDLIEYSPVKEQQPSRLQQPAPNYVDASDQDDERKPLLNGVQKKLIPSSSGESGKHL